MMGLGDDLKRHALGLSQRAVERLLADEKRAMRIAGAIGKVQRGREAINRGQDELLRAFGFASKSDYRAVSKQLATLKRRVRELEEKLDKLSFHSD
jgi:polyhydroxyalkanoate synthesis regulator phasin